MTNVNWNLGGISQILAGIYYALVISLRHVYSHAVARLIANCRTYYISFK